MQQPPNRKLRFVLIAILLLVGVFWALLFWKPPEKADAKDAPKPPAKKEQQAKAPKPPSGPASTNAPSPATDPTAATPPPVPPTAGTPPTAPTPSTPEKAPTDPSPEVAAKPDEEKAAAEDIQLSFQGANIDMIVQWLAKTTGKSVVKHPRVQCQLTIVSSKKLSQREALNVVYRALSLEGFTAIESHNSILIVPDGQEPKLSPQLVDASQSEVPEGRQRLVKVFPLKHIQSGDLKDKVRSVLSEKATIETDERANQIIVTDYTDNIRLIGELIKELDVTSVSDSTIEIYSLKHAEADELVTLLGLILNPQSTPSSSRSSSGGSAAGASTQVRLWPDKTSNRIIVTAPKSRIPEIENLIELLDTEKTADVAVRVLPLKHVSADDLVKEIGPLYQKMSGKGQKDVIEVTANSRSNSLIILSSETNYDAIEQLVYTLDTDEAQEKIMQAFALRNADAEDVASQLQELHKEQDSSSSRMFYYSPFSSSRGSAAKKMSVVADRRRNTVIVQAPPAAMEGIAQMIETLDEPVTDNSLAPKIFQLKYVSAQDIEDVLNELFLKKQQQQRNYWDYYYSGQQTTERDVGRLYGKVRITSEPYSNSLIVTANSTESLAAIEEVLEQLDVPSQAGETTLRVGLKFAEAVTVASSLNILFARGGAPPLRTPPQPNTPADNRNQQQQGGSTQRNFELEQQAKEDAYFPWLGGQQETSRSFDGRSAPRPVSDLVGRVRVVPDRRSNSLLITANVHFFPQVLKLINDLDAPTAQVLIEAKIIEVSTDFREKLGVRWTPDGRIFDESDLDNSVRIRTSAAYRDVFVGTALENSLRTGILDSSISLDLLVQFLRKNTGSRVLAEPRINIADNELGKLFVGAQVPFIDRTLSTDVGGLTQTFSYRDVGVILEVTPHINNSDEVALKIRAESSNIRSGQTLFGGAILDTRNFRTDLLVKSGETVILGGIIQREDVDTVRKVPLLGDIPGLGWAFKKKDKVAREVELMVFLRPIITRTPEEAKSLIEEMENKLPRLKEWRDATEDGD